MNYSHIVEKASRFVAHYFQEHEDPKLLFHNLDHTRQMVKHVLKIAMFSSLGEKDVFFITLAAWFCDTGYLQQGEGYQVRSAEIAVDFLKDHGLEADVFNQVETLIEVLDGLTPPANRLEQIMCDADSYDLGKKNFSADRNKLRKELELIDQRIIGEGIWLAQEIAFFEEHQYYTTYCKQSRAIQKAKNLHEIIDLAAAWNRSEKEPFKESADSKLKKAAKAEESNERGIDTMFRIASSNAQRLSNLGDRKAHILITVNSIILSAVISLLLRRLSENAYLSIPTYLLLSVSLISMIFAIRATRPALPPAVSSAYDMSKDITTTNLLFFGNFYHMDLKEYTSGMKLMMEDRNFLYNSLIKDVYYQGKVLGKKYALLRLAYNVFMYGLVAAVTAFIIAMVLHTK